MKSKFLKNNKNNIKTNNKSTKTIKKNTLTKKSKFITSTRKEIKTTTTAKQVNNIEWLTNYKKTLTNPKNIEKIPFEKKTPTIKKIKPVKNTLSTPPPPTTSPPLQRNTRELVNSRTSVTTVTANPDPLPANLSRRRKFLVRKRELLPAVLDSTNNIQSTNVTNNLIDNQLIVDVKEVKRLHKEELKLTRETKMIETNMKKAKEGVESLTEQIEKDTDSFAKAKESAIDEFNTNTYYSIDKNGNLIEKNPDEIAEIKKNAESYDDMARKKQSEAFQNALDQKNTNIIINEIDKNNYNAAKESAEEAADLIVEEKRFSESIDLIKEADKYKNMSDTDKEKFRKDKQTAAKAKELDNYLAFNDLDEQIKANEEALEAAEKQWNDGKISYKQLKKKKK